MHTFSSVYASVILMWENFNVPSFQRLISCLQSSSTISFCSSKCFLSLILLIFLLSLMENLAALYNAFPGSTLTRALGSSTARGSVGPPSPSSARSMSSRPSHKRRREAAATPAREVRLSKENRQGNIPPNREKIPDETPSWLARENVCMYGPGASELSETASLHSQLVWMYMIGKLVKPTQSVRWDAIQLASDAGADGHECAESPASLHHHLANLLNKLLPSQPVPTKK